MNLQHAAKPEHGHARQVKRANMIKRTGHKQPGLLAQSEYDHMLHAFPIEIVIAMHDAFWPVSRSRSIHEAEKVIGPDKARLGNLTLHP